MSRPRRWAAALALAAAASTSAVAARGAEDGAAPWVLSSADGALGVWRARAPGGEAAGRVIVARPPDHGALGAPGLLDLDAARPGAAVGAELALETTVRARAAADVWLLLAGETEASVELDGRAVARRALTGPGASAWTAAPLALGGGEQRLRVVARRTAPRGWTLAVRLLERETLAPPAGLATSPGEGAATDRAWGDSLAVLRLEVRYATDHAQPVLELLHPAGALDARPLSARGSIGPSEQFHVRLGQLAVDPGGAQPLVATLPPLDPRALGDGPKTLRIELLEGQRSGRIERPVSAAAVRAHAAADAAARAQPAPAAPEIRATLAWRQRAVSTAATPPELQRAAEALETTAGAIARGPAWLHEPGWLRLALPSPVDGAPDPLVVHVPRGHTASRRDQRPLVLLLHGFDGTPESVLRAFLDGTGDAPHPTVDGFVVAPSAHGNAFYRGPGEAAAMAALDWALATYPIDRDRVTVAGVSMGGTGAAHLALRYPGTFAGASPLCGYQSWFVRRDTRGVELRPWERARLHSWSPASWAASGRHVPLFIAHGQQDLPLENSRVLIDRYRALGNSVVDEWPDLGHSVWTHTWKGAGGWAWLARQRRPQGPPRVTLATDSLRYGSLHWVRVTALQHREGLATVDARVAAAGRVEVTTAGVTGLELEPPGDTPASGELQVVIDGTSLRARGARIALSRDGAEWRVAGATAAGAKRAGLEGPIGDAWLGPLAVAWGSGSPATGRANREIGEELARWPRGARISLPVFRDAELPPDLEARASIVAVGTPDDHSLLAEVAPRLAVRWAPGGLRMGSQDFAGPGTGAVFVQPNPRAPGRYLVVVTGVDAPGIWRAASLPTHLPDFLVYDDALAPAAGHHLLDRGGVRTGGFFLADWTLPADATDRRTPPGP